jgi:hypothetical protein
MTGWVGLLLAAAIAMGTLTACREEGPAEKAGKALDKAAADAQDAAEDAKKDLKEALGE